MQENIAKEIKEDKDLEIELENAEGELQIRLRNTLIHHQINRKSTES
jgi:hypothetical protein